MGLKGREKDIIKLWVGVRGVNWEATRKNLKKGKERFEEGRKIYKVQKISGG